MITVIHPQDKTTAVLQGLYQGLDYHLIDESLSDEALRQELKQANPFEIMMLLGQGSDKGLFVRADDNQPGFDRILIDRLHDYYLCRQHRLIGIWSHADLFAKENHLSGLFTGRWITTLSEAYAYGVETSQEELDRERAQFVMRLRSLIDEGLPLSEIPERLRAMDEVHSPLTDFNYKAVYYIHFKLYDC